MFNKIASGPGIATLYNTTAPSMSGAVYWDGLSQQTKIIDSCGLAVVINPPTHLIQLDAETQSLLLWVMVKMSEEAKLKDLMEKYPGLKDLNEKFEMMLALVKQNGS